MIQLNPDLLKKIQIAVSHAYIQKLEATYSDFINNIKGFDKVPNFFREHLYLHKEKENRDKSLKELYLKLKNITGPQLSEKIYQLIQLTQLTDELDLELAKILLNRNFKSQKNEFTSNKSKSNELNLENSVLSFEKDFDIQIEDLEWALRKSNDNHKKGRFEQIEMVCGSLKFFFSLSKMPMVRLLIAPIKVAASMVGADALISTIEAGFDMSKNIDDIDAFIEAFKYREIQHLETIYST